MIKESQMKREEEQKESRYETFDMNAMTIGNATSPKTTNRDDENGNVEYVLPANSTNNKAVDDAILLTTEGR